MTVESGQVEVPVAVNSEFESEQRIAPRGASGVADFADTSTQFLAVAVESPAFSVGHDRIHERAESLSICTVCAAVQESERRCLTIGLNT
jgi:hypothetical protein